MMYLGEEANLAKHGSTRKVLSQSHTILFSPEVLKSTDGARLVRLHAESNWSVQMTKLIEPLLLDMVGDDGKGSNRLSLSQDVLRRVDYLAVLPAGSSRASKVTEDDGHAPPPNYGPISSRGTSYWSHLMRIMRSVSNLDAAGIKSKDRSRLSLLNAVVNLLPAIILPTTQEAEEVAKHTLSSVVHSVVADSNCLQRVQVVVDIRLGTILATAFSSKDVAVKNALVKTCVKVLSICANVPAQRRNQEPFRSLAREFTSAGWVNGLVTILRGKITNLEISLGCAQAFRLMANDRAWMKAWPAGDVLPVLLHVHKAGGMQAADLRCECMVALRLSAINRPEGARLMVDMRLPGYDVLPGTSGTGPVDDLLAEANDMRFGSTLSEQDDFSKDLTDWIAFNLPTELPERRLHNVDNLTAAVIHSDDWWNGLYSMAYNLSAAVPKMCLALAIKDLHASGEEKKEKQERSCRVSIRQISIVERILLSAYQEGNSGALPAIIGCLWMPKENQEDENEDEAQDEDKPTVVLDAAGTGILSCMEHLTGSGVYLDPFESLRVQFSIMQLLIRLVRAGRECGPSSELLQSLLNVGVVRVMCNFIMSSYDILSSVMRLGLTSSYGKEYKRILDSMDGVWACLVETRYHKVYDEIIDSGLVQRLVEEYLPSKVNLQISSLDAAYNPLVVRAQALGMLQLIALTRPQSERLVEEAIKWVHSSHAIERELDTLRAPTSKKGSHSISAHCWSSAGFARWS